MRLSKSPAWVCFALSALAFVTPAITFAELSNKPIIGPGVRVRPAYDGSDAQRAELVPVVRYLGEPWFLRSTQGVLEAGARLRLAPGLHAGIQLAYEPGRKARESDFLESRNVTDVDYGASVGAHIEWDHEFGRVPVTVLARGRQHTDSDRGGQADLRFSIGVFQRGKLGVGLFTQATWANAKATRSFYGVTPEQSIATGLPTYAAGSGLLSGSVGILYSFDLSPSWAIVGNVEARRLQGDARHSPLVERRTNYFTTVGAVYRF